MGFELRLAVRGLRRRPVVSAAAIVTLALGIGASTAIYSVVHGVSIRPLAYHQPDRLMRLSESKPATSELSHDVSVATFHAWRESARSVDGLALFSHARARSLAGSGRERLITMRVSPGFFDVLGIPMALGDGFRPEADYTRSTVDDDIVVSHEVWRGLLGGRPDVIGTAVTFAGAGDDDVYRIVGVLPAGFQFEERVDVWTAQIVEVPIARVVRGWRSDRVVGRLAPDASLEQSRAELETISARLARDFPDSHAGWTTTALSLHESVVGEFGRRTWLLLASVVIVLALACVNVAGLITVRAIGRQRETAVRVALGASGLRLLRLWGIEALVLALGGLGLGLALGWAAIGVLKASAPPGIPRLDAIRFDRPTLLVAVASMLTALIIFTAAPLWRFRRRDVWRGLASWAHGSTGDAGPRQAGWVLTFAQCAGAAALVMLAVLFTQSLVRLMRVELGWTPDRVAVIAATPRTPAGLRRPWHWRVDWSDRVVARLQSHPLVADAAVATQVPLSPSFGASLARGRGRGSADADRWPVVAHSVTDRYFALMNLRLVDGRLFDATDRFDEPQINQTSRAAQGVAIVTARTARTLWPDGSGVGRAIWLPDTDNTSWREVVGVVDDIQFHAVGERPTLHVFLPFAQSSAGPLHVLVKGARSAAGVVPAALGILEQVEPGTPVDRVDTLESLVGRATAQPRFTSRAVLAFAALALALAAVGVYGMLSSVVAGCIRDIGIRMAIGATRLRIAWRVIGRALVPAVAGACVGLIAAVLTARAFRPLLFETDPVDAVSLTAAAVMVVGVVVAAALLPAGVACRVDPAAALRAE